MTANKKFQFVPFLFALLLPLCIGALGSIFTVSAIDSWYTTLNKPTFNPPNEVFGPVWSSLYIIIGIASYLIWQQRKNVNGYNWAVGIYILQLLLNLMWSMLFFYLHQIGFALVEIMILLVVIIANGFLFYRINKIAGLLFIPYFLWVSFASYLTYSIYILN